MGYEELVEGQLERDAEDRRLGYIREIAKGLDGLTELQAKMVRRVIRDPKRYEILFSFLKE